MKTIYKYKIPNALSEDCIEVVMPIGAQIIHFGKQDVVSMYIWAIVNTKLANETRRFRLIDTGHELDDELTPDNYIGTIMFMNGKLVHHLFEIE